MTNTFTDDSDYLMHYGVLGMKWGVRKDRSSGSSSSSGSPSTPVSPKASSGASSRRIKIDSIKEKIRASREAGKEKRITKKMEKRLEKGRKDPSKLKNEDLDPLINRMQKELQISQLNDQLKKSKPVEMKKISTNDPKKMSSDQLQAKINRMETEKRFRDLSNSEKSQGRRVAESVLMNAGKTVLTTAAIGAATYGLNYALKRKGGSKSKVDFAKLADQMAPLKNPSEKKKKKE